MPTGPGLAKGAIGALESAVMGVAGTAPAVSVAVTAATIVAAVGDLAVGSILYCGLIIVGLMLAFKNLNKMLPHAGGHSCVGRGGLWPEIGVLCGLGAAGRIGGVHGIDHDPCGHIDAGDD